MTIEQLRDRVQALVTVDIGPAYRAYCDGNETPDPDLFLSYLFREGLIDSHLFSELHASAGVEITMFPELGTPSEEPTVAPERCDECGARVGAADGQHSLLGLVGEGSMGEIHVAKDLDLGRKVAFKRLKPHAAAHQIVVERFLTEVQITAQLDHPNIVPVYKLETPGDGEVAYSMKLVRGKTFKELITGTEAAYRELGAPDDEHQLSTRLGHFLKVCDAVHYAHSKRVIHRDLKPDNIMIGRYNEVYVMDWGIARLMTGEFEEPRGVGTTHIDLQGLDGAPGTATATQDGQVIGTPAYMSPEQAQGFNEGLDPVSESYALGLILFQLVSLRRALPGSSAREVLENAQQGTLVPLTHLIPGVTIPRELQGIIEKATSFRRDGRYATVGALAEDIRRYRRGEAVLARPDTPVQRVSRWIAQHHNTAMMLLLVALLVSTLAALWGLYHKHAATEQALRGKALQHEAEQLAERREQQLGRFLGDVGRQTRRIDNHFLRYEGLLESWATAVQFAMIRGTPVDDPLFYDNEMKADPDARPADMRMSKRYGIPVSTNWPVVKLAPGVKAEAVRDTLRRLATLRRRMQWMVVKSRHPDEPQLTGPEIRKLIAEDGAPLVWVFCGLECGVHFSFPGKYNYDPTYDPRKRPWYQEAKGRHGARWGSPYGDAGGQGLLLPCHRAMYDDDGKLIGVAAVELTFDYLIEHYLEMTDPAVIETFLVDGNGMMRVRSTEVGVAVGEEMKTGNKIKPPEPLPFEVVREGILDGNPGGVESLIVDGAKRLVSYTHLASLGWYYVVLADADRVFR